ncbi:hypothetical protein CRUP_007044 [Coryphaenoides rupestris]|nr:hypothetical protein CRUP_007044 [Coryphaenoides rupestris]
MDPPMAAHVTQPPALQESDPPPDGGGGGGTGRPSPPLIAVHLCGSTGLLWRTAEMRAAREAGVVGSLVGALPRQPRQNGRLGRPLQLGREEVRLLVESRRATAQSGEEEVQQARLELYEEAQRRSYEEQSILALEDRKSALLRAMGGAKQGGGGACQVEGGVCQVEGGVSGRLEVLDHNFVFPRSAAGVQISTARPGWSHFSDKRTRLVPCSESPLDPRDPRSESHQDPQDPRSESHLDPRDPRSESPLDPWDPRSESRFLVFRDLRQRGYYITSAGKFGGDFLVYPGDPLRFHAHFIAVCVSAEERLPLLDVLAVARLGSNVKKTVLLCSPGPGGTAVRYTSLQWSGMA